LSYQRKIGVVKLGRYNLLKPIARGGMGEVYLATAGGIEGAERPCVVKVIRREHAQDTSFLARFFDEARIQAQLHHPGVAQVLEAATDPNGMPYVVLEHIEGKNLGEVRQRAGQLGVAVSWADAVAVLVSMTEALCHVHERTDADGRPLSIVHRDLSPQNVMVGYGGDVKLIDFGTARGENRRCQTVAGVVFAKPGYVAPEVANGIPGGAGADIYALGVILWELIMGRKFLIGDPEKHLAEVASGRRAPQPVSLTNNVPLELDAIIERMTAYDVNKRYGSAREVKSALLETLKRAPSLADGERGVRPRIAHLMSRLYPSEPAKSRAEFAQLLAEQRKQQPKEPLVPQTPAPSEAVDDQLLPGTRYRLVREIAKSAMSSVWAAEHVDLGRKVAIKLLPKERSQDARFERSFRTEARALATLRHPNLVQLHDFGVSIDGRPYYAMELLSGETLRSAMDRRPFRWPQAARIGVQLLSALSAAHQQGIVHRDIKPDNVFLTEGSVVKLLDFGVAQTNADPHEENEPTERSAALEVTGTVEYMAPEQVGKKPVDERADLYAVGAVLYELLTGQRPHQDQGTAAVLDKKRLDMPMSTRKLAPGQRIPFSLDLAVMKALAPRKEDRFADAAEMQKALERLVSPDARGTGKRVLSWGLVSLALPLLSFAIARYGTVPANGSPANDTAIAAAVAPPPVQTTLTVSPRAPAQPERDEERHGRIAPPNDQAKPSEAALPTPTGSTATDEEPQAADAERDPELSAKLALAQSLMRRGATQRQRSLELMRKLGEAHPDDPLVLEQWSKSAASVKWWGESLRVAIRWAAIDPSEASHLHLARTQRLVGQRFGAIQTLERFLDKEPASKTALAALEQYRNER
jgi:serine/threonine-protein kinase